MLIFKQHYIAGDEATAMYSSREEWARGKK
jgi:hypothetical protein